MLVFFFTIIKSKNLKLITSVVYRFPKAAVTKYHKLGGLRQQKYISYSGS